MFKFITLILISYVAAAWADIPDDIKICRRGDNDCIAKTMQYVLKKYSGGLSELNLLPFDPMLAKSLVLPKNPSSPVNLELQFADLDVIGLKTGHVAQAKGFTFEERTIIEIKVPELILKGSYVIDGNVLILPIKGNGASTITCKNIVIKYTFDMKPVDKNGQKFAQIEHVKLEFTPELVQYHFDNLFNGDKALGDNMNKFINENWRDIYNELEAGFAKGLSLVVKKIINNVYSKIPYDVLLPN